MTSPLRCLVLDPADNVAIALDDLPAGEGAGVGDLRTATPVPKGHKLALAEIAAGAPVVKLRSVIGVASRPIGAGEHVHTHNLHFVPSPASHAIARPRPGSTARAGNPAPRLFQGYVREDGRVGTRNVLLVLATVNCSATVARRIAEAFRRSVDLSAYPGVDGVVALTHQHGCSFRADGPGMDILRRTLGGYARHPNVAGTLVVGLGCEDNQVEAFLDAVGLAPSERLRTLVIQHVGGTAATVAAGVEALKAMLPLAAQARREPVPASRLVVGLQCGGSDGFSAITANPALGAAADLVVEQGGTVILAETPEIYGAEHLLLQRAVRPEVGEKLLDLIAWWERSAAADKGSLDNNPSAGNKAGGLSTILEKSLGAVAKAGSSPLEDVVAYAEPIRTPGLVFMDSPGYDPVSATGQVASGANLLCFTTGRGSCFGSAPAPSLKLATNTPLFRRMEGDMDLDCGGIADGLETPQQAGERIFAAMLDVASGRRSKSEELGYGEEEFMPWAMGLTY
ncbi:MAG: altronate dehydratase family protein [Alsobacter sp.]